jgi:hypothetical protein
MSAYLNGPDLGKALLALRPVREFTLAKDGALLACTLARYATMAEYVEQFAPPLSSLPAQGLATFRDPIHPEVTIVVEGELRPWCARCGAALDDCACAF